MARFYATMQGNRGMASRTGTPGSGLESHTRGWNIGAIVVMGADGENDRCSAQLSRGSSGGGTYPVSIEAIKEPERAVAVVQIGDVTVLWNSEDGVTRVVCGGRLIGP